MNYREAWANGEIEAGTLVDAIEEQAREIERLEGVLYQERLDSDGQRQELEAAKFNLASANAALKAKPSGVVLPERWSVPRPIWKDARQPYGDPLNKSDIEAACKFNLAIDEVARLNQPSSAGGVDERAAFEAWYLGHFYMGDKQCGLEWLSTEPCGGYRHQHPAEQWIVWQARAALSAPSHGEQVERLQMQLVACGVVALANTPESAARARDMHPDYMSASCSDVMRAVDREMHQRTDLLDWAVECWHAEVSQRPLVNVNRRSIDDTWRQIIRRLGGDPVDLCGPDHDTLIATAPSAGSQCGDV